MVNKIILFGFCVIYNFLVIQNIYCQPTIFLEDLLTLRKDIKYIKFSDAFELYRKTKFLLSEEDRIWWEQNPVLHPEVFILFIPCGQVHYYQQVSIVVDEMYVDEFVWSPTKTDNFLPLYDLSKVQKKIKNHSKIAVIPQGGMFNYYHWMVEVLPRLGLLQESGIDYDYLCIPLNCSFMKETMQILGIDMSKVIQPLHKDCYLQADELIIPSITSAFGYSSQFTIDFLRNKFIPLAQASIDSDKFSKKVFISRRKAVSRKIVNEDEVFALFQEHGFVRYNLEELSVLEQVMLFHNAEMIVGEHGAGLTNIMFAQPGTQVVEIFQARDRGMYFYLAQDLGLEYIAVKTIPFDSNKIGNFHSTISLDSIKNIIIQLFG